MKQLSKIKSFKGSQYRYQHCSEVLDCNMCFSLFLPSSVSVNAMSSVPLMIWLSGLTCTDENFVTKAGVQQFAEAANIAILAPDTSPRGDAVADDPDGHWDFGLGAGFYVNATEAPFSKHYKMYDYICFELLGLVLEKFPIDARNISISGHSMGGHGALVIGLRNPEKFRSISAFAPIIAPSQCPWGEKAFSLYLGTDKTTWLDYDSLALLENSLSKKIDIPPIKIDQGSSDSFLKEQLRPDLLEKFLDSALAKQNVNELLIDYQLREGYDHSYFFIASFIQEHILFHKKHLEANG